MEELNIGDTVYLKSGGFPMTLIIKDEKTKSYTCVWHDKTGKEQRASYPPDALTCESPNPQPPGIYAG